MLSCGGSLFRARSILLAAAANDNSGTKKSGGYAFFEDAYPKAKPGVRVATWEEQQGIATVKNMEEPKKQLTESEKLHKLHDWKQDEDGSFIPAPEYGWVEEWGPDPTEDGHDKFYEKPKAYMTSDEEYKLKFKTGVPLAKGEFRHQEMPYNKRIKGAMYNLAVDKGQWFDTKTRNAWSQHSPEEKTDYVGKAKEDFQKEWLAKPGVTPENMAMKMAEYNGSAKGKTVKPVERIPEWELAPRKEFDD